MEEEVMMMREVAIEWVLEEEEGRRKEGVKDQMISMIDDDS